MYAILYRVEGENRLVIGGREPEDVDHEVVASADVVVDPSDLFEFVSEDAIDAAPVPTIEEVTDAFDPWLAWYGGDDEGSYAVLYGRKDADDRRVWFRARDGDYEVGLEFGTVESAGTNGFEPNDCAPVEVVSGSQLYAKRVFHDFCDVA